MLEFIVIKHFYEDVSDFHALAPGDADSWVFEVRTDEENLPLSLTWAGSKDILDRSKLIDNLTGEVLNAGKTDDYVFEISSGSRSFTWELKGKRGNK